ncbi:MAG: dockerin type I repeat-containing protein, partial [Acutalibacteraceae bacterium]
KTNTGAVKFDIRGWTGGATHFLRHAKAMTDGNSTTFSYADYTGTNGTSICVYTGSDTGTSDNSIMFMYDLLEVKEISEFLISWGSSDAAPFNVRGYNIYVADNININYTSLKLVASKHDESDAVCNRLISLSEPVKAKCVWFEFTYDDLAPNTNSTSTYKRLILLTELGAYSTPHVIPEAEADYYSVSDEYGDVYTEKAADNEFTPEVFTFNTAETDFNSLLVKSDKPYMVSVYGEEPNTESTPIAKYAVPDFDAQHPNKVLFSSKNISDIYSGAYVVIEAEEGASITVKYAKDFTIKAGDLTGDNAYQADDLVLLRKELLGNGDFSLKLKDANGDGSFNLLDLVNLKKKV